LALEIVHLGVDAIVTQGTPATRAAKQATATIPIVMFDVADPVRRGLVASLARPGGNVTGLTNVVPEITAKRLSLLKEAMPHIARVAVLWDSAAAASWSPNETLEATRTLGLRVQPLQVGGPRDLETALQTRSEIEPRRFWSRHHRF
jgi:putative ABC transport system substrate-binding protein